jgi:anti-sigma regulatory factor (Ser/Thr protein kinase)
METPEGNSRRARPGLRRGPGSQGPCGTAGGTRPTVLDSLTIPGRPEQVAAARAFVARTISSHQIGADVDAATLLTSEIVTNAVQHTKSGVDDGTVTIVVIRVRHGVLVEVIDDGSAGTPVVKGDLYAADGHGLYLVQHLAAQWGYLREPAGTTVWFHLPAADRPQLVPESADPRADAQAVRQPGRPDGQPTQLRAATVRPATAWTAPRPPSFPPGRPGTGWPGTGWPGTG